jgi:conjugative relaxase-like TrwC/TraI family protein
MIRMIQSQSADHAKAYFTDALHKSDYYTNDQELPGQFLGKLGKRLGVEGTVTREQFFALCENRNPISGESLTPRTQEKRTVGYDINFHAPKSLSILNAFAKDLHLQDAFQASVRQVMAGIEADIMTRVRIGNADEDRKASELVWGEFIHLVARPADGAAPDPHLHAHCFVINATFDETESKIKAGQFREIKRSMPFHENKFHKILSDKLIDLGYTIKKSGKSFEIEGVPKGVINLFSKRSNEIGQFAKDNNITDDKTKDGLGARTRSKKQKGLTMSELKAEWRKQISENVRYEDGEQEANIRYADRKVVIENSPTDCLQHSIKHSFERASVMSQRKILSQAYKHSIGTRSTTIDAVDKEFEAELSIIKVEEKGQQLCTTVDVLREEKQMVKLARDGFNKFMPLYSNVPFINLKEQQARAIEHILTTKDQVSIIMGAAGSGKTTLMTEAVFLIEQTGKKVTIVAPSAQASRGTLRDEGFGRAETVAKLLQDEQMQDALKDQVLWVDEAGLLSTKDMTSLLEVAKKQNTRLMLGGDTRQFSSIERGDSLRILNTVGGIKAAEVNKIYRQRDQFYREAVEDLAKGRVSSAFEKLDSIDAIKQIDPMKPNDELIADYVKVVKTGKTALIVSPTHQQGESVTSDLREKLRSFRLIGDKEIKISKFSNLHMTEAERSDWRNFQTGQAVQFNQHTKNIKRGSIWTIDKIQDGNVVLTDIDGKIRNLPLDRAKDYSVYHKTEIGISKGDKVRITHNCFDENGKRLNNGQALEVSTVNKSDKTILVNPTNGREFTFDKDFGHIDHNYFTTSHSAQGKTVDEVFISQPASTFVATDAKQFYVSVSRGRDNVRIYTDDKEELLKNAENLRDRQSAIELTKGYSDYVTSQEQQKSRTAFNKEQVKSNKTNYQQKKQESYEPEL